MWQRKESMQPLHTQSQIDAWGERRRIDDSFGSIRAVLLNEKLHKVFALSQLPSCLGNKEEANYFQFCCEPSW